MYRYTATARSLGAGMRRREFISLVGVTAAAWPLAAGAQSAMKHIGALMDIAEADAAAKEWVDASETQLSKSGWREGRDCDNIRSLKAKGH